MKHEIAVTDAASTNTAGTSAANRESSLLYSQLKPGDRVEVDHVVTIGSSAQWSTRTLGTVVRKERRRHGLHFRRNPDDKVYSDVLISRRRRADHHHDG